VFASRKRLGRVVIEKKNIPMAIILTPMKVSRRERKEGMIEVLFTSNSRIFSEETFFFSPSKK